MATTLRDCAEGRTRMGNLTAAVRKFDDLDCHGDEDLLWIVAMEVVEAARNVVEFGTEGV